MASPLNKLISSFLLLILSSIIIVDSSEPPCRRHKSIITFGDSIADTGNYLRLSDVNHLPQSAFLPYGETFFHPPSGRYSDGRLIIDFIGFKNRPLAACCGVGGKYNFTVNEECGYRGVGYCQNPSESVNWDGYHLTEAAYREMAHGIINGPYAIPAFDWSCLGSASVDKEYSFSS